MADLLVDTRTVSVGHDLGGSLEDCVRSLADLLAAAGRLTGTTAYVDDVLAREAMGATVLPGGVALPHARSAAVVTPSVAVATLPAPVTGANGQDFDLVFLLGVPDDRPEDYLQLLKTVTAAVVRPSFRQDCRAASDADALAALVGGALHG